MKAILGRKIGMMRYFTEEGRNIPVTVIQAGPCYVSQLKTTETDGYNAIQVAFEDMKARNSTMPLIGHDAKAGLGPMRHHHEIRLEEDEVEGYGLGDELKADVLEEVRFVDVTGTSKGKGFAGGMKRHGFKGLRASHGVKRKHRSIGSIGGHAMNAGGGGGPKKGKKMPGQMGSERVTVRSLDLVEIDKQNNLILVKGPVPGHKGGLVEIKEARRLYKSKAG
ncbi:MAG: 50S ribosomal protein L3 [Phycisphaeraceae bacterium]|nr:50S ribosomal protein L3 [Phycisphaeraceae bacterium]